MARRPPPDSIEETKTQAGWELPDDRVVVEDEYAPPPPPSPHRELWIAMLVLLVLVLGGLAAWLYFTRDDEEEGATAATALRVVPSVVGRDVDVAVDRLHDVGFTTEVRREQSRTVEEGRVVEQEPAGGERAEVGSKVVVVASSGPPLVAVPRVVGLPLQEAVDRLEGADLEVRSRSVFSQQPRGEVVRQVPEPGEEVKPGTAVRLDVSKGPQRVPVPDVVGLGEDDAVAALRRAGFDARAFGVPSEGPAGTVVAQNPPGGAQAASGDSVRINVSEGRASAPPAQPQPKPKSVTMPNVVGQRLRNAQRRLRDLGLLVRVFYVPSQEPQGIVVAQRPQAGATVRRGSEVRLNVSEGPSPAARATVPDVIGLTEEEAVADLEAAGFEVEVFEEDTPDQAEEGLVIRQEPEAGSRAPRGALITIYVGRFTG
jgi:beta-lactam-binding protein with PASTA domain